MRLSIETLAILKNFSTIFPSIVIKEGNVISTMSSGKDILADAVIKEEFKSTFAIYDLNNFLSVISLFKDGAELEFDDKHVYIAGYGGRSKIKYRFTDLSVIEPVPTKRPGSDGYAVDFRLSEEDYQWIVKTANVLSSPHIAIESNDGIVRLTAFDLFDDSAHSNSLTLHNVESDRNYKLIFKTDKWKMLPGSYNVSISPKGHSKFVGESNSLTYYITLEIESYYN